MGDRQARIRTKQEELSRLLQSWGLPHREADRFAYELAVKVERILTPAPNDGIGHKVLITDRYHTHNDIRIFIRRDVDRKPEEILADFIERSKGLPALDCWVIERRATGADLGGTDWIAKAIKRPPPTPVRTSKKKKMDPTVAMLAMLKGLDPERLKKFVAMIQEQRKMGE